MNNWNMNDERQSQINYGRQQQQVGEVGTNPYQKTHPHSPRATQFDARRSSRFSEPTYRGHNAFLRGLLEESRLIQVKTIADEIIVGNVKAFDEETISLHVPCPTEVMPNAYQNIVLFKRNLISFTPFIEGVTPIN
ncbi:hypothetical protein [Acinetobacter brisouii]|uniref:hypothetical protein n=1 Tax=Acinetobacter brisouii TaxID=396323 RepID=UPI00124E0B5A|nr:hypothetical protein [Acinetobacter brisouii]